MLRKKWLSLLVAISMVAAMFPSTVFATSEPAESAGPAEPASQTSTEVPEDDTLVTEGNETPDVVTDAGTDTDETDQSTDETVINTEENTEEEPPAEGTQPEETTEEIKVEETKPEQPTVPETTPAETPNSTTSEPTPEQIMAATQNDISTTAVGEEATPKNISVTPTNANDLQATVDSASEGDTIVLAEGEYNIGILSVKKAVNFKGAGEGKTKITGAIYYQNIQKESLTNVTVRDLTLQYGSGNQGICVGGCKNIRLNVLNCQINDYLFGIGVNSGSTNCIVDTKLLTLENVWCGTGICTSDPYNNKLYNLDTTEDSTVQYAVQAFASGLAYNNYYYTEESYKADVDFTNPDQDGKADDFQTPTAGTNWPAVAKIGDNYYGTLEDAVGAATNGTDENPVTITLTDDVELDKMLTITTGNVVLDLGGHEITASGTFTWQEGNQNACHLVQIGNDGVETSNVTIRNGTLKATGGNKNTLNVYKASNVTLGDGLKVDHTNGVKGAPLVINASDVTLTGDVEFVTGAKSWYSVNVDSKGEDASLNFAENANVTLGESAIGIQVDGSTTENMVTLAFDSNVNVTGSTYPVLFNNTNTESVTVTGIENSNLKDTAIPGAVAIVNGKYYTDLQAAVDALPPEDGIKKGTIYLVGDVNVEARGDIQIPAGAQITIEGNGHSFVMDTNGDNGLAAFSQNTSMEGLKKDTELTVKNATFVGSENGKWGYAVLVGSEGGVKVDLSDCTFKNLYDAVYCQNVSKDDAETTAITITNAYFSNVAYSYGVDDGATPGALTGKHNFKVIYAEGSEKPESETFAVAEVKGVGYDTLAEAITAAGENGTVTLLKDVALDDALKITTNGLTLDLDGHKIYASETFPEKTNLIQLTNDAIKVSDVTIKDGTLEGGSKHTLNVWNAEGVILEDLTLDNTKTTGGAPLVVGGSDVTLDGNVTFKTNDKSWYGANVDTAVVNTEKQGSSLTVNGHIAFEGKNQNNVGIWVQDEKEGSGEVALSVTFGENSSAQGNGDPNFEIVHMEDPKDDESQTSTTVGGLDNAGLIPNGNGGFVKPAPAPSEPSTGSSHEHSYVWQGSPDEHWQYCTECGQVVSNGAHTFQWKDGVQVCSVCGYKVTQTTSTSTAPAGNTAAAAAAPAAGTTATAATGIPQTSDNSNPMLWVVLLALSGSALGGMTIYKKKREN